MQVGVKLNSSWNCSHPWKRRGRNSSWVAWMSNWVGIGGGEVRRQENELEDPILVVGLPPDKWVGTAISIQTLIYVEECSRAPKRAKGKDRHMAMWWTAGASRATMTRGLGAIRKKLKKVFYVWKWEIPGQTQSLTKAVCLSGFSPALEPDMCPLLPSSES